MQKMKIENKVAVVKLMFDCTHTHTHTSCSNCQIITQKLWEIVNNYIKNIVIS